ncbi:MAG: hypothetical protein ACR2JE_11625 [Acidobacteriaceae bacterium]
MGTEIYRWQEGPVDHSKEHFELRFGSADRNSWNEWIPVAVIAPPDAGAVSVQFLIEPNDSNANIITKVKKEINFYLLELGDPDPWKYAQYHCGTISNAYSDVHWSFFQPAVGDPI